MRIRLLTVGTKMPSWVEAGVKEYHKRLPRDFNVEIVEIPLAPRNKTTSAKISMQKEGEKLLAAAVGTFVVALDKSGKSWPTEQFARQVDQWKMFGKPVSLLVGGPDGLSPACLAVADASWSLSEMTLPHPLVRIVVMEQLYRAWAILNKHPYHK